MVFTGKPSTGCETCRKRRIKCDETRPNCHQCMKVRRSCPGPKNRLDVALRYMYSGQKKKRKQSLHKIPPSLQKDRKSNTGAPNKAGDPQPSADPRCPMTLCSQAPSICVQTQANAYFVTHYVLAPCSQGIIGFTGFYIPLATDKKSTQYWVAFDACAMAAFTNGRGQQCGYENLAIWKYNKALMAIYTALQDPAIVYEDATLASILLLALFECISPTTSQRLAWSYHIKAAIKLAAKRGQNQAEARIGHTLFREIRMQMVIYRLITLEDRDDDEFWWQKHDSCGEYASIQRLCVEASTLGTEGRALLENYRDEGFAAKMLAKCRELDQICETRWLGFFQVTPHKSAPDGDEFSSGQAGQASPWLLPLWNLLTCARILLNSIIIRCAVCIHERIDYRNTKEYLGAYDILQGIVSASIATNKPRRSLNRGQRLSLLEITGEKSVPGLRGHSMVLLFAFIRSLGCLTEVQKTAVSEQMGYVRLDLGIRHALSLRGEKEIMPPYWFTVDPHSCTTLSSQSLLYAQSSF